MPSHLYTRHWRSTCILYKKVSALKINFVNSCKCVKKKQHFHDFRYCYNDVNIRRNSKPQINVLKFTILCWEKTKQNKTKLSETKIKTSNLRRISNIPITSRMNGFIRVGGRHKHNLILIFNTHIFGSEIVREPILRHQRMENQTSVNTQLPPADDEEWFLWKFRNVILTCNT